MPGCAQAAQKSDARHDWNDIQIPDLPARPDGSPVPSLSVSNGDKHGLQFALSYTVANDEEEHRQLPDSKQITVRLHAGDKVVAPQPDTLGGPVGVGNGRSMTFSYMHAFPWQQNALDEAWIELRLPGQTYWVELPYGFARDPSAPLPPQDKKRGDPAASAPAMKTLGKNDRIVSWLSVQYDLGEIQNHWRLSVNMANPFDAQAEVELYREDSAVGKSMYLWDLHEPRTAISIRYLESNVLASMARCIRLHDDGFRRSDYFHFNRDPSDDGRCWGTATVTVADKPYEFVVPSSLFKYVHGTADHNNKGGVPRQGDRWPYRPG